MGVKKGREGHVYSKREFVPRDQVSLFLLLLLTSTKNIDLAVN